jgi:hypothetical protein
MTSEISIRRVEFRNSDGKTSLEEIEIVVPTTPSAALIHASRLTRAKRDRAAVRRESEIGVLVAELASMTPLLA